MSFIRVLVLTLLMTATLTPLRADEEPARKTLFLPKSPTAAAYVLGRLSNKELIEAPRSEFVYVALLQRKGLERKYRVEALEGLAKARNADALTELIGSSTNIRSKRRSSVAARAGWQTQDCRLRPARGGALLHPPPTSVLRERGALPGGMEGSLGSTAVEIRLARPEPSLGLDLDRALKLDLFRGGYRRIESRTGSKSKSKNWNGGLNSMAVGLGRVVVLSPCRHPRLT